MLGLEGKGCVQTLVSSPLHRPAAAEVGGVRSGIPTRLPIPSFFGWLLVAEWVPRIPTPGPHGETPDVACGDTAVRGTARDRAHGRALQAP